MPRKKANAEQQAAAAKVKAETQKLDLEFGKPAAQASNVEQSFAEFSASVGAATTPTGEAEAEAPVSDNQLGVFFNGMDEQAVQSLRGQAQKRADQQRRLGIDEGKEDDGLTGQGDAAGLGELQDEVQAEAETGDDALEGDEGGAQDEDAVERDRALLIHAGNIPPKIAKSLSDDAIAAMANALRAQGKQNTATSQDVGDGGSEEEADAGATSVPSLPKMADLLKPVSEHFDAEVAAALGKSLEGALGPVYDTLKDLHAKNIALGRAVQANQAGQVLSTRDRARAALTESFGQLRDDGVFAQVADAMTGLSQTRAFKNRQLNDETVNDLMRRAARAIGLKEITPAERQAALQRKRVGQPHVGTPTGRQTRMAANEKDALNYKAAVAFSQGRDADARAILARIR